MVSSVRLLFLLELFGQTTLNSLLVMVYSKLPTLSTVLSSDYQKDDRFYNNNSLFIESKLTLRTSSGRDSILAYGAGLEK